MISRTRLTRVLAVLLFSGCARTPLKGIDDALRLTDAPSNLSDDLPLEGLIASMVDEIKVLERDPLGSDLRFGSQLVNRVDYATALRSMVALATTANLSSEKFAEAIRKNFDFFEVYGDKRWGDVFMTSYFEPVIQGSLKQTARFSRPLYRAPGDMVEIPLDGFSYAKIDSAKTLIGRLVPDRQGGGGRVLPYYSRQELDQGGALSAKKLEICWVDPIDAFVLQIQGSGIVEIDSSPAPAIKTAKSTPRKVALKNRKVALRKSHRLSPTATRLPASVPVALAPSAAGTIRIRVGYAAQNGYPYEAVGSFLRDVIPSEKMSLQSIEAYLRTLPADRMQDYLNKNPSYVFFKELTVSAITSYGVAATAGRTIATDSKFFPKGALGFLMFDKPKFDSPLAPAPSGWQATSRWVMDQDKGGAIKGPGRMDLFWGSGPEAKQNAGVIKQHGRLFYLAPKADFIAELHKNPPPRPAVPAANTELKL